MAAKYGEGAKVALRNLRRDCLEIFKKMEKGKEISEDDLKKFSEKAQKVTDNFTKQVDDKVAAKEKEIKQV